MTARASFLHGVGFLINNLGFRLVAGARNGRRVPPEAGVQVAARMFTCGGNQLNGAGRPTAGNIGIIPRHPQRHPAKAKHSVP